MAKMIVQRDRKTKTLSLYKLYGQLQAQESTVMKDYGSWRTIRLYRSLHAVYQQITLVSSY